MTPAELQEIKETVLDDYDPNTDSLDEGKQQFYGDNPTAAISDIEWYSKTILQLITEIERLQA